MGKGSGDNERPSLMKSDAHHDADVVITRETPIVKSANYGHSHQLLGGITIQQQRELLDLARTHHINGSTFLRKEYNIDHAQYIPSVKLPTILKSLEKQIAEDAPKWELAQQLTTDSRWGYGQTGENEARQRQTRWLVHELAARLGVYGQQPMRRSSYHWDSLGTDHLAVVADEMMALHQGHPLRYTVKTTIDETLTTLDTTDVQEVHDAFERVIVYVRDYLHHRQPYDDYFEEGTPEDWEDSCVFLRDYDVLNMVPPHSRSLDFDDEEVGTIASIRWSVTAVPSP